jgi:hypothetical protein
LAEVLQRFILQNVVWSVLVEMLIYAMVEFDFDSVEARWMKRHTTYPCNAFNGKQVFHPLPQRLLTQDFDQ